MRWKGASSVPDLPQLPHLPTGTITVLAMAPWLPDGEPWGPHTAIRRH